MLSPTLRTIQDGTLDRKPCFSRGLSKCLLMGLFKNLSSKSSQKFGCSSCGCDYTPFTMNQSHGPPTSREEILLPQIQSSEKVIPEQQP